MAYIFGSIWDRFNRNALNDLSKSVEQQGKSIQDLVAEGQLTPSQYAQLVSIVNGNVKKGSITTADIDKNNFAIDQTMITDSLRQIITGNAPINAVPANNSLTTEKYADNSVTKRKKTVGGETAILLNWGKYPDIDLTKKTITIYANSGIIYSKRRDDILTDSVLDFVPGRTTSVIYDTANKTFRTIASASAVTLSDDEVYIAHLSFETSSQSSLINVIGNFEYTVNGENRVIKDSVHTEEIEDGAVTPSKTSFIETLNLFNNKDLNSGYSVDATTGELTPISNQNTTHFIRIGELVDVTFIDIARVTYYDSEYRIIRSSTPPLIAKTTTDRGTAYVRLTTSNGLIDGAMMYLGHEDKEYVPYYVKVMGVDISRSSGGSGISKSINDDYHILPLEPSDFYLPEKQSDVSTNSPQNLKLLPYSDINKIIEDLSISHPHYVKKVSEVTESSGRKVQRYDFIPENTQPSSLTRMINLPKIMIVNGLHGSEKTAVWCGAQGMKDIVLNWQSHSTLEYLRWNVHIIYIPLGNPSGWEYDAGSGNKSGTRKNGNGVDLARNFPTGWSSGSPDSGTYGGTSPLSEVEAQFINQIYEDNKDDLIYAGEFHNYFALSDGYIWNASNSSFQVNMGESIVRAVTAKGIKENLHSVDETTTLGHADLGSPNGSFSRHVSSDNIPGSTFEVGERVFFEESPVMNSPTSIQWGTGSFISWLMLLAKNVTTRNTQ